MLRCGARLRLYLHLSPDEHSVDYNQDSHQSDYGTRSVQAPSSPLPMVLAADIPMETWEPL